jgi:hypothetical protein
VGQSHSVGLAGADSALSSNVFDMVLVGYVDSMTSSGPTQSTYIEVGTAARAIRDRDGGKKPSDESGDRFEPSLKQTSEGEDFSSLVLLSPVW